MSHQNCIYFQAFRYTHMKRSIILPFLALALGVNCQSFELTDTEFDVGDSYTSYQVLFDYDSFELLESSKDFLKTFAKFMISNPELSIEVGCHTDLRGSEEYNQKLSEMRADVVVQYLGSLDIELERLSHVGHGESEPLITDADIDRAKSDEEKERLHGLNRRTTFTITVIQEDTE